MHFDHVAEWVRKRPFEPFVVQTTTGEEYPVYNREFAWLGWHHLEIGLFDREIHERSVFVALEHIAKIERLNGRKPKTTRAKKKAT